MDMNRCKPLYDVLTGLDFNFRLQIFPSQTVDEDIKPEFIDKLKYIVNYTMGRTIGLQRREVSVWYLPISQTNPKEYYLFNIYLLHPNDSIRYGRVVGEIYNFFKLIKDRPSMSLSNGQRLKLEVDFGYSVVSGYKQLTDIGMNSRGKLLPLMENGWKPTWHPASMYISGSNWCLRTVLTLDEVQVVAVHIFKLKATGMFFYADQFDFDTVMFVCIDFIRSSVDSGRKQLTVVNEHDVQVDFNDNNEFSGETVSSLDKTWAITGAFFGAVTLWIILYKVKSVVAKRDVQHNGVISGVNPDSDFGHQPIPSDYATTNIDHVVSGHDKETSRSNPDTENNAMYKVSSVLETLGGSNHVEEQANALH